MLGYALFDDEKESTLKHFQLILKKERKKKKNRKS